MNSEIITGLNIGISDVSGLAEALAGGGASVQFGVHTSVATALAAGTDPTKVALDTVDYDTSGGFNATTNRFTAVVAGYYAFTAGVNGTAPTPSPLLQLALCKNGAFVPGAVGFNVGQAVGGLITMQTAGLIHLNGSTDYVELWGLSGDDDSVSAWMVGALT